MYASMSISTPLQFSSNRKEQGGYLPHFLMMKVQDKNKNNQKQDDAQILKDKQNRNLRSAYLEIENNDKIKVQTVCLKHNVHSRQLRSLEFERKKH